LPAPRGFTYLTRPPLNALRDSPSSTEPFTPLRQSPRFNEATCGALFAPDVPRQTSCRFEDTSLTALSPVFFHPVSRLCTDECSFFTYCFFPLLYRPRSWIRKWPFLGLCPELHGILVRVDLPPDLLFTRDHCWGTFLSVLFELITCFFLARCSGCRRATEGDVGTFHHWTFCHLSFFV